MTAYRESRDQQAMEKTKWPLTHEEAPVRVMTIQSHVCRDYVGNRVACPILQALGFHVDEVNSCIYSSLFVHKGLKLTKEAIHDVLNGLRIATHTPHGGGFPGASTDGIEIKPGTDLKGIITGYIPKSEFFEEMMTHLNEMKRGNGTDSDVPLWLCDPVLGDMGRLYVEESMVKTYADAIQFADCITPNWYELQLLSYGVNGSTLIKTVEDVVSAIDILENENRAPKRIVCSSIPVEEGLLTTVVVDRSDPGNRSVTTFSYPQRADFFIAGTGDVFSSVLFALLLRERMRKSEESFIELEFDDSVELALSITQAFIDVTMKTYPAGTWRSVNPVGQSAKELLNAFNTTEYKEDKNQCQTMWQHHHDVIAKSKKKLTPQ